MMGKQPDKTKYYSETPVTMYGLSHDFWHHGLWHHQIMAWHRTGIKPLSQPMMV